MKNLLIYSFLILLVSCAGQSKKERKDELDGVTNDSFKMPPAKLYQVVDDFIDTKVSDEPNVLKQESLSKVEADEIEEAEDVEGDITKILVSCYRGQFDLGFKIIDKLYREYRENPIYWTQVGSCYLLQGSKRKALLFYNKAREIKKSYAPPVNNIGVIFQKSGFDQKALKAYEEAKRVSRFSLTPLFNLAQLYVRFGFHSEAETLLQSMYRMDSEDQDVIFALGFLKFTAGDFGTAVKFYNKLDRSYYKNPRVGSNIAYALAMVGEGDDALDVIDSLDRSNEAEVVAYLNSIKELAEKRR